MGDMNCKVPDQDQQHITATTSQCQAEEIEKFILEITNYLNGKPRKEDWSTVERKLENSVMKLPPTFTVNHLFLYLRRNGFCNVFFDCIPGRILGTQIKSRQLSSFFTILLDCAIYVKELDFHGEIDQSTDMLQKRLQASVEVASLQDLCFATIRSRLPLPVSDEILEKTDLPRTLYATIRRKHLVTDIMNIFKTSVHDRIFPSFNSNHTRLI